LFRFGSHAILPLRGAVPAPAEATATAMRLTRDQVELLAQHIVRGLLREEHIAIDAPEPIIDAVAEVLTADLAAEDALNEEVREMLKNYADDISRGSLNYQELFRKVKSKLARERKMVI
jgi:hypothetical protein